MRSSLPIATPHLNLDSSEYFGPVLRKGIKYGQGSMNSCQKQASKLDENRIVLYKKGKQLGLGYYIIEVSSNTT
jgi:hypothetical protein